MGLGSQDDFPFALRFLADTGVQTPNMVWDPSFETWRSFGVSTNSQMMLLSPDLETGSELFFGFDEARQAEVLDVAANGFGG